MTDFPYFFQNAERLLLEDVQQNARTPRRHLAALEEVWNLSFRGLTAALVGAVEAGSLLEEGPGPDAPEDPVAAFGRQEAQRHRERGVSLDLFLGLMKVFRPAYLNLARRELGETASAPALLQIGRFFDRVEIAFCVAWIREAEDGNVQALQQRGLEQLAERDRYVAIFESIPMPILLLDPDLSVRNMNHAAHLLFLGPGAPGAWYYQVGERPEPRFLSAIFPGFFSELEAFLASGAARREHQWSTERAGVPSVFRVIMARMLDLPGASAGILVTLDDQTERVNAARERETLVGELTRALAEVTQLTGLLPICSWCKKIRDDQGYWNQLEGYLASHSGVVFSHGVCPECAERVRAELPAKP